MKKSSTSLSLVNPEYKLTRPAPPPLRSAGPPRKEIDLGEVLAANINPKDDIEYVPPHKEDPRKLSTDDTKLGFYRPGISLEDSSRPQKVYLSRDAGYEISVQDKIAERLNFRRPVVDSKPKHISHEISDPKHGQAEADAEKVRIALMRRDTHPVIERVQPGTESGMGGDQPQRVILQGSKVDPVHNPSVPELCPVDHNPQEIIKEAHLAQSGQRIVPLQSSVREVGGVEQASPSLPGHQLPPHTQPVQYSSGPSLSDTNLESGKAADRIKLRNPEIASRSAVSSEILKAFRGSEVETLLPDPKLQERAGQETAGSVGPQPTESHIDSLHPRLTSALKALQGGQKVPALLDPVFSGIEKLSSHLEPLTQGIKDFREMALEPVFAHIKERVVDFVDPDQKTWRTGYDTDAPEEEPTHRVRGKGRFRVRDRKTVEGTEEEYPQSESPRKRGRSFSASVPPVTLKGQGQGESAGVFTDPGWEVSFKPRNAEVKGVRMSRPEKEGEVVDDSYSSLPARKGFSAPHEIFRRDFTAEPESERLPLREKDPRKLPQVRVRERGADDTSYPHDSYYPQETRDTVGSHGRKTPHGGRGVPDLPFEGRQDSSRPLWGRKDLPQSRRGNPDLETIQETSTLGYSSTKRDTHHPRKGNPDLETIQETSTRTSLPTRRDTPHLRKGNPDLESFQEISTRTSLSTKRDVPHPRKGNPDLEAVHETSTLGHSSTKRDVPHPRRGNPELETLQEISTRTSLSTKRETHRVVLREQPDYPVPEEDEQPLTGKRNNIGPRNEPLGNSETEVSPESQVPQESRRVRSFLKTQEPGQKETGVLGLLEGSKPNLRPKNRVQATQSKQKGSGPSGPSELSLPSEIVVSQGKERFPKPLMGPGVSQEQEEVEVEEPRLSQSSALDERARSLAHRGAPDLTSDVKAPVPVEARRRPPRTFGKAQSELGESQQDLKDSQGDPELGSKRQVQAPLERTEGRSLVEILPETAGAALQGRKIQRALETTKEGGEKETESRQEVIKSLPTHKKSLRTIQRRISHPDTPLEMTTHTFRFSNGGKRIQKSGRSLQKVVPDVPSPIEPVSIRELASKFAPQIQEIQKTLSEVAPAQEDRGLPRLKQRIETHRSEPVRPLHSEEPQEVELKRNTLKLKEVKRSEQSDLPTDAGTSEGELITLGSGSIDPKAATLQTPEMQVQITPTLRKRPLKINPSLNTPKQFSAGTETGGPNLSRVHKRIPIRIGVSSTYSAEDSTPKKVHVTPVTRKQITGMFDISSGNVVEQPQKNMEIIL